MQIFFCSLCFLFPALFASQCSTPRIACTHLQPALSSPLLRPQLHTRWPLLQLPPLPPRTCARSCLCAALALQRCQHCCRHSRLGSTSVLTGSKKLAETGMEVLSNTKGGRKLGEKACLPLSSSTHRSTVPIRRTLLACRAEFVQRLPRLTFRRCFLAALTQATLTFTQ